MDSKSESRNYSGTKPPSGYYGSEHRLASQIIKYLPPHNAWVEASCGSAAMTLAKLYSLSLTLQRCWTLVRIQDFIRNSDRFLVEFVRLIVIDIMS